MNRIVLAAATWCAVVGSSSLFAAADRLPLVSDVAAQPLKAQVERLTEALTFLGEPLPEEQRTLLIKALDESDDESAVAAIQEVLDPFVLIGVNINPEQRVKLARGEALAKLVEQGWRSFLIKVHNEAGINPVLRARSPNAAPMVRASSGEEAPRQDISPRDVADRWLDLQMFDNQPLTPRLSGLTLEYRIVQLHSRDRGQREATLAFDVGQGSQDIGFRNEIAVLFECQPAVEVTLEVLDDDGQPTTGHFVFRDAGGRVYPARSRRLAPDFFFHDQVYRKHGESVRLPAGSYEVTYTRGPEYEVLHRSITVPDAPHHRESFRLRRWIKLADLGWFSGDHHVHAAGCAHYEAPTQGVMPDAMMRHIMGEDLNVGCVLSWGPCWYFQKDFFEGKAHDLSTKDYLMRYDVGVSGFPSSHAGHLCLLRLTEDDYPGTDRVEEWPSWDLPVLQWGRAQGGVVGFSHSGWGLQLPDILRDGTRAYPDGAWGGADDDWKGRAPDTLPDYVLPRFDGIGANEYVVDVTHGACDFISTVDTPSIWELNVWYHTLNCGYTCRISGETDFPCIYGERVGLGRVYVRLDEKTPLTFDQWVYGVRDGRSYCGDGLSHLVDFAVNGFDVGAPGDRDRASFLAIKAGDELHVTVKVAALLESSPNEEIRARRLDEKPYWHVERARVDNTRMVPVELIVNGQAVERKLVEANGQLHDVMFNFMPTQSSWVALRILPSSHTNPVFVEVDGRPIRASRRSAEWCAAAVDICWNSKQGQIRASERDAAKAAYDSAQKAYLSIAAESFNDSVDEPQK